VQRPGRSGKHVSKTLKEALVVPGSMTIKAKAEAEGLDKIFRDAGFEWRDAVAACALR